MGQDERAASSATAAPRLHAEDRRAGASRRLTIMTDSAIFTSHASSIRNPLEMKCRARSFPGASRVSGAAKPETECLLVEPDVFEAPAVIDAVDHRRQPLDVRLPAGRSAVVPNYRPRAVLLQLLVDLPDQLPAFLLVGLHRLPVEQLFDLTVAVAGIIALRTAGIVFVELLVGVVDRARDVDEADL